MSEQISITINRDDIKRIAKDFKLMDDEVPVALSRAINHTLGKVKTEMNKQVRQVYTLKRDRVAKDIWVYKSNRNSLHGYVRARGRPVGLRKFSNSLKERGYKVKVMTGGEAKLITGSFIRISPSTKVGRTGPQMYRRAKFQGIVVGRLPIRRLSGPRVEDALAKPRVQRVLQDKADTLLAERLDHEASYILSKAGK